MPRNRTKSRVETKRFVVEVGSDCPVKGDLPKEYANNKSKWTCDVSAERTGGVIDEYSIDCNRKIYLERFLKIIKGEVKKLTSDETVSWAIHIYRIN